MIHKSGCCWLLQPLVCDTAKLGAVKLLLKHSTLAVVDCLR